MTEMIRYEVPGLFPETKAVSEAITQLNNALPEDSSNDPVDRSLGWPSQDGHYFFSAAPLSSGLRSWQIVRIGTPDDSGETTLDDFRLIEGHPLYATRHTLPIEELESGDPQKLIKKLNEEGGLQHFLGVNKTELTDYAIVDGALFDLNLGTE